MSHKAPVYRIATAPRNIGLLLNALTENFPDQEGSPTKTVVFERGSAISHPTLIVSISKKDMGDFDRFIKNFLLHNPTVKLQVTG